MSHIRVETLSKSSAVSTPSTSRSFVFETERQRNTAFLQKGITKPGRVTFETLRRAANSVHVARICINTLKEKITKTKWVIQPVDPKVRKDAHNKEIQEKIERVTQLFKNPNPNEEGFRALLDKMLEDLLVLDTVCLEKTRYEDGSLAELHFVDAATIRPVFDEHGNKDVELPLIDAKNALDPLPVSYVQVMDNSQYGGPESGQIIAAWPNRDFIRFHMHPQGSIEGIGYGLSPLEGVLSVVANLLNADNYNGTYFEDGSFPPTILHFKSQMQQRDLEALKEYLNQEVAGNFHRPMVMAGSDAEILNLKESSNQDMQFMEYMKFLARLLAAAYGLSGQDIGLTDDVGSKNVSETQREISNSKGYSSILDLLKRIFDRSIIQGDFGFTDLEFSWVADDMNNPQDSISSYKEALSAGLYTINEVRQKLGELPYEEWADEQLVLTADGYKPALSAPSQGDDQQNQTDMPDEIAEEAAVAEEEKGVKKSTLKKLFNKFRNQK